jgi:hypothetical protein
MARAWGEIIVSGGSSDSEICGTQQGEQINWTAADLKGSCDTIQVKF